MRDRRPKRKDTKELLEDMILVQRECLLELRAIKEGLSNMASEVVAKVNAKFDEIQATLEAEAQEIKDAIAAAGAGDATPEEVAALEARGEALKTAISALVAAPAPPPTE